MGLIRDVDVGQPRRNSAPSKVKLVIRNYSSKIDVRLVAPMYVSNGPKCDISPYENICSGATMRAYVKKNLSQGESICALMYKLRKNNAEELNGTNCTQLVMIWKIDNFKRFHLIPRLIERDKGQVLDRDRLMRLAQECALSSIPCDSVEETWLVCNGAVLATRMNVTRKKLYHKLEMVVCEGNRSHLTRRPQHINMNSIESQPTMKVHIRNQCSDFKLTDGRYISTGADWNKDPGWEIDTGRLVNADLIPFQSAFEGVLSYRLQRKHVKPNNQRESTHIRLFVAWKSEDYKNFRMFVHLIKHDEPIEWNEIRLDEYYQQHANQLSRYAVPINETWSIGNDTVLMTKVELDFTKRDGVLNVTISKGTKNNRTKRPVRFDPKIFDKKILNITASNHHPDLELISPVYFSAGTTYRTPPSQRIGTGNALVASFGIDSKQKNVKGAVLYKLRRRYTTRTGDHPNGNIALIENTATNTYLLAVWDVENAQRNFYVCLIECADNFTWDEDKLCLLYWRYNDQFCKEYKYSIITWLMNDSTVMETELEIAYGTDYKLNIIISEAIRRYNTKIPIRIDPESLSIKPSARLNIYSQCLNVDLVSPIYVTDSGLECYRPPDYKVYAGDAMKSGFIIDRLDNASGGVLICKLQRKQSPESTGIDRDASNVAQLLVVWRISESNELCADVLLIEHNKRLDEDNLRKLYHKNIGQFRLRHDFAAEIWLLNNNTVLRTTFEIKNEDKLLNITIFELARHKYARTPAYITPKSLKFQLPACIAIHNQCSNTELVSPVYLNNGAVCLGLSDQQIDVGANLRTMFKIDTIKNNFEGALLFKLKRYTESDDQHDMDTSTTEADINAATHVHLLIAWRVKDARPFMYVILIEHTKEFIWDENKLNKLYYENHDRLKECNDTVSSTWFMFGNMTLRMTVNARDRGEILELNISVSEEEKSDFAMRPLCVDLESLILQSTVSLNIHNRCQAINLASPVYFMHGGRWDVIPDQEIDGNAVMRNHLELEPGQDMLGGALVYRVQTKQCTEYDKIDQDESKHIWLLVAWRGEYAKGLHVHALLIEHNKKLDEDRLRRLHRKHWHLFDTQANSTRGNWMLDDTTMLVTTIRETNGGYRWDIFISERTKHNVKEEKIKALI